MEIYEQIYTSAPELLDTVSSNLGVIAQTRGFPKEVEAESVAHRSYTLRPEDIRSGGGCPPRFAIGVCGHQKSHLVMSRVCFAGADHTGRTKPFAHHLAIQCKEMLRGGATPSMIANVARRTFRSEWQSPPSWLDPLAFEIPADGWRDAEFPSSVWEKLIPSDQILPCLVSIADLLVAVPASRQPVVLCIRPESADAVIDMIADLLALVPQSVQLECVCVSHVVEMADYLRDSALIFTYPDTPFLQRCLQRQDARRPVLFDLTRIDTLPRHANGPYANTLLPRANGHDYSRILSVVRQWDEWGLTPEYKQIFTRAVRLRERMATTQQVSELPVLAAEVSELANTTVLRSHLDVWATELLRGSLLKLPDDARWKAVAQFACDERWPSMARNIAFDELVKHSADSLAPLLEEGVCTKSTIEMATRELVHRLQDNPSLASDAVRLASRQPTELRVQLAASVMAHAKAPFEAVLQWWEDIASSSPLVQRELAASLVSQLFRTSRSSKDIMAMRDRANVANPNSRFNQDVYCRVLRNHFASASTDEVRRQLAGLLMNVAIHAESADAAALELRGLHTIQRSVFNSQQVEAWLQQVRGTSQEPELRHAAVDTGLLTIPQLSLPIHQPEKEAAESPWQVNITPDVRRAVHVSVTPMRVGRSWGVLPSWTIHVLAVSVIGLALSFRIPERFIRWGFPVPNFSASLVLAGSGFVLWMMSAVTNALVSSHPQRLSLAFAVRWIVALLLIALLSYEFSFFWPLVRPWWPG